MNYRDKSRQCHKLGKKLGKFFFDHGKLGTIFIKVLQKVLSSANGPEIRTKEQSELQMIKPGSTNFPASSYI